MSRVRFSLRHIVAITTLALSPLLALAGGNSSGGISVSGNNTHIDRGVQYTNSAYMTASGGTAPYSFSLVSGMPSGIGLNSDGSLSGMTCGNNGSFSVSVNVTDATNTTSAATASMVVNVAPANGCALTFSSSSLGTATVGTAYSSTLSVSGNSGTVTYSLGSGTLPAGLSLSSSGAIAGTPTASGTYSFSVIGTDTAGDTGSQSYSMTVANAASSITVSPTSVAAATVGTSYSTSFSASGGTGPYTFALSSGAFPSGLSISSSGVLAGTPTAAGTYSFGITATDSAASTGARTYSMSVAPVIAIAPASLPNGTVYSAYSQTITSSGGTSPYTVSLLSGALPSGFSLSSSGVLAGTTSVTGSFAFTVRSVDASGYSANRAYSLSIVASSLTISPTSLGAMAEGTAYSQSLSTSGGQGAYTYAVTAGSPPTGLSLSSAGVLSGMPLMAGGFSFTVTSTDVNGYATSRAYSPVVAAPTITIAPSTLPAGTAGTAYSQTLTASGGIGPYTFSLVSGSLPTGVTISTGGALAGSPTSSGTSYFQIMATDSRGYGQSQNFSLQIAAPVITVAPGTLPAGTVSTPYSSSLSASGGTGPYTYAVSSGTLPAGLSLAANGALSGTPTTAANASTFTVTATDAHGFTGQVSASMTINSSAIISISPGSLPSATAESAYSQALTASGGVGPYSFTLTAGALPNGISLSAGGVLSGTATASGSFTFSVRATDANGVTATHSYTFTSTAPALTLTGSPAAGTVGQPYSQTLSASGGVGPYLYAITSGSLPAGLSLSSSGQLTGNPTTAGSYAFTITATDADGFAVSQPETMSIAATQTLVLTPASLPSATVGASYTQALSTSGGTGPYTYTVASGTLPTGLTLSSTGVLAGTASLANTSTFTVTSTDTAGHSVSHAFTLSVATASSTPLILTSSASTISLTVGAGAVASPVVASGGTGPYSYAVSPALPAGLTYNSATGVVSGTPTSALSAAPFTFTVTDSSGHTSQQAVTLSVSDAVSTQVQTSNVSGMAGQAISLTPVTASGGVGPYAFTLQAALPAGLSFDSSTGVLWGTPVSAFPATTYVVTVTDVNGAHRRSSFVLAVGSTATSMTISGGTFAQAGIFGTVTLAASGGQAPYQFSLVSSSITGSLSLSPSGVLSGTPRRQGSYVVTVRVVDANGAASTVEVTVAVGSPPNPANDTNLTGLLGREATVVLALADAQRSAIESHLEQGLGCSSPLSAKLALDAGAVGSVPLTAPSMDSDCSARPHLWLDATVSDTRPGGATAEQSAEFLMPSATLGADVRVRSNLLFGLSLGAVSQHDVQTSSAYSLRANSSLVSAYGVFKPDATSLMYAVIGSGAGRLDASRTVVADGSLASGSRSVSETYVAFRLSTALMTYETRFEPYAGAQYSASRLGAYNESGTSPLDLHYDQARVSSLSVRAGLLSSRIWPTAYGVLEPTFRLEFSKALTDNLAETVGYLADPSTAYNLTGTGLKSSLMSAGLGVRWYITKSASSSIEYRNGTGSSSQRQQSIRGLVNFGF